ncbi:MAG: PaaI family thioesterase [Deltaproteobacteria bacterium]|nr:PaaI family thioesterase [Deltaproteobacteria bacterium]
MDEHIRSAIMERLATEAYGRKLSLELIELSDGYAVVEMMPDEGHRNMFDMVHGGAIISLMDEAFQASCNSHGRVAVALNMNVAFHHPPKMGHKLRAESREIHRSNKTGSYEIKVWSEDGVLIASCQALAYRKREALPFLNR